MGKYHSILLMLFNLAFLMKCKYSMLRSFLIFPGYAEYQAWGQWSACSEQCGGGKRKRERACTSNSIPCSGGSKEEETCNTQACTNSSKY